LPPHEELENTIAAWKRSEAALTFSSGYAAAVGILPVLAKKGDIIILDKLSHASLVDGARLSGADLRVFPHNDLERLQRHLVWARKKRSSSTRILIVTESIFSMDGDRCPLHEIVALKNQFGAILLLDEAHAVGVLGKTGAGLVEELDCVEEVEIQIGTLSKAIGSSGGYVCGSRELIDIFINCARSFIFSTAPPACVAAAATEGIRIIFGEEGTGLRRRLWENIIHFSQALSIPAQSAIIPWKIGEESQAVEMAAWLEGQGFLAPAIRYPTVAKGAARIRFTFSAAHQSEKVEKLSRCLISLQASC
jgi:glycine C-acetyltransferase/8-amino-7-oxononanoate synthase